MTEDQVPPFMNRLTWPITSQLTEKQRWEWMVKMIGSWALIGWSGNRLFVQPKHGVRLL
jgi:hypothetical protein